MLEKNSNMPFCTRGFPLNSLTKIIEILVPDKLVNAMELYFCLINDELMPLDL